MKRIGFVMAFCLSLIFAKGELSTVKAMNFTYTEDGATYTYTDAGILESVDGAVGDVDLCQIAEKCNITIRGIGANAFKYGNSITSVHLPATVQTIDSWAFSGCSTLCEVTYEKGSKLTVISEWAFCGDSVLTSFYEKDSNVESGTFMFPDSLRVVGERAFNGTVPIKVILPDNLMTIPQGTFEYCDSLITVDLPGNLTAIGDSAFWGTSLTSLTIPDNVKQIGDSAFGKVESLTTLSLPGVAKFTIGKSAFSDTGLKEVTIPANCTQICENAFGSTFEQIMLTAKIESNTVIIQDEAFSKNVVIVAEKDSTAQQYVTSNGGSFREAKQESTEQPQQTTTQEATTQQVTTQETTTEQATTQQAGTTQQEKPTKPNTTEKPTANGGTTEKNEVAAKTLEKGKTYTVDGLIYRAKEKNKLIFVKPKSKSVTKLVIPDFATINGKDYPVVEVAAKACYKLKKLRTAKIGANVVTIKKQAFSQCKNLYGVSIGEKVTTIGDKCFYKDKKIRLFNIRSKRIKKFGKNFVKGTSKNKTIYPPDRASNKLKTKYKDKFKGTLAN